MSSTRVRGTLVMLSVAACTLVTVLLQAGQARAGIVVDDFESFTAGQNIHGVNGWSVLSYDDQLAQVDPTDSDNMVLAVYNNLSNIYKGVLVPNSTTKAELFFRFYVPGGKTPDVTIQLTDVVAPSDGSHGCTVFRVASTNLQVHDVGWRDVGSIATGIWYSVTLDISNPADTFEAFIQGGTFTEKTQLGYGSPLDTVFNFRHAAGANDLVNFFIRTNAAHAGDTILVDDVQVTLIPEPSGLMLALIGLAALVGWRRRRLAETP